MPTEGEETNETKVVHITSNLDKPITLEKPDAGNSPFKLELKTVQEGKQFDLNISYAYAATNGAVPNTPITIKTSSTNMPTLSVTAYAMPQPSIVAYPQQIQLPPGTLSAGYKSSATLRINSRTPAKLLSATVNAKDVKVETTEPQPGKIFTINLEFPDKFQITPGKPVELTLKTSHPKRPEITIPISQLPSPIAPTVPTAKASAK